MDRIGGSSCVPFYEYVLVINSLNRRKLEIIKLEKIPFEGKDSIKKGWKGKVQIGKGSVGKILTENNLIIKDWTAKD